MVCGGIIRYKRKPFGQIGACIALLAAVSIGASSCGKAGTGAEEAIQNTARFLREELPVYQENYRDVVLGEPHVYMGLADITQDEIPELFVGAEDNAGHIWFTAYSQDLEPLGFGFDHEASRELFRSRRYEDPDGRSYFLAATHPKSAVSPGYTVTKIWNDGEAWRTQPREAAQTDAGNGDRCFWCRTWVVEIHGDTVEADVASGFEAYFALEKTAAEK